MRKNGFPRRKRMAAFRRFLPRHDARRYRAPYFVEVAETGPPEAKSENGLTRICRQNELKTRDEKRKGVNYAAEKSLETVGRTTGSRSCVSCSQFVNNITPTACATPKVSILRKSELRDGNGAIWTENGTSELDF